MRSPREKAVDDVPGKVPTREEERPRVGQCALLVNPDDVVAATEVCLCPRDWLAEEQFRAQDQLSDLGRVRRGLLLQQVQGREQLQGLHLLAQ